jgi:hypothetical protein
MIGDYGDVGTAGGQSRACGEAYQSATDDDHVTTPEEGGVAFRRIRHFVPVRNAGA